MYTYIHTHKHPIGSVPLEKLDSLINLISIRIFKNIYELRAESEKSSETK